MATKLEFWLQILNLLENCGQMIYRMSHLRPVSSGLVLGLENWNSHNESYRPDMKIPYKDGDGSALSRWCLWFGNSTDMGQIQMLFPRLYGLLVCWFNHGWVSDFYGFPLLVGFTYSIAHLWCKMTVSLPLGQIFWPADVALSLQTIFISRLQLVKISDVIYPVT
jgi:hypothetical protein